MKKIYSTAAIIALCALTLFSSCKKTEDDEIMMTPVNPESSVLLNETTNTTGSDTLFVKRDKISALIQVTGVSKTTTDMKRIYVYKKSSTTSSAGVYETFNSAGFKQDNAQNYYYDIPGDQRNNTRLTLTVSLNANNPVAATDEYYFAFTDGTNFAGPTNTAGILLGPAKIFIVYGLLTETTGHRINNIKGPNSGAFDLFTLTNKAAADLATGKDMIDYDETTPTWDKSFSSGTSGTLYAKLPSNFDYQNATDITIKAAYTLANNAIDTQEGVVAGNMYVANIRGTSTSYALVRVSFISNETGATGAGNNNEYMEFSVKK